MYCMKIQYIFRDKKLPELIIFLQKMVRGTLARKRAKKMRAALKVIRNDKVESCVIYLANKYGIQHSYF